MYTKLAPYAENTKDVYNLISINKKRMAPLQGKYDNKDNGTNN